MTQEQTAAETQYQLARCIYMGLCRDRVITNTELNLLPKAAAEKYHSVIGELEATSIAGDENHTG